MGVTIPIVAGVVSALAAGTSAAVSADQANRQRKQVRQQRQAQDQAKSTALANQRRSEMSERAANPNQPEALALLGKEQLASLAGVGSSSLAPAVPKLKLGKAGSLGV